MTLEGSGLLVGFEASFTGAGACPAPLHILMADSHTVFMVLFITAITGTFLYGKLLTQLPL